MNKKETKGENIETIKKVKVVKKKIQPIVSNTIAWKKLSDTNISLKPFCRFNPK